MKKIVLSAAAVFAMSSFAVAGGDIAPVVEPVVEVPAVIDDSGFYIGAFYGFHSLEGTDNSVATAPVDTAETNTLGLMAGYKFNSYVAVEGRYQMQVTDPTWSGDSFADDTDDVDGEVASWAVYVKPMYPVTNELDVYALIGYASTTYTFKNADNLAALTAFASVDDEIVAEGFSWGIGASYEVMENLSVFVDYTTLYDDSAAEFNGVENANIDVLVTSINAGVSYKF